ncbi:MAG: DUF3833 family protein [Pseudomonadota bacterium]|uniref:DUF3833 family protein n=1 Tax=Roseovarius TaxID=74030 RepID=UPI0022A76E2A|nr:DUF3833 family protein [Roseovarius sp. EGI FJ00037]MCZ0811664.1 DUF3833 family protein [Roseovarius sp. EGI FJ00037]
MSALAAVLALILGALLVRARFFSFRSQKPGDYAEGAPAFSLQEHLSGEILSEGVIFGPDGRMTNSFVARMSGKWDGDAGVLSEDFTYSNGSQQARAWHITLGKGGRFTATADDIRGVAQGRISGSTVMMRYRIVLPKEAGAHVLDVTDWLYLTRDGAIMNRSQMRKFGVTVAELVATMRPAPEARD